MLGQMPAGEQLCNGVGGAGRLGFGGGGGVDGLRPV